MAHIDWLLIVGFLLFIGGTALTTLKYTRSVADFLSANRCAGRYLLGVADGMAGMGAISIISFFEQTYAAGTAPVFWATLSIPIGMIIALSGFITYRYRETRAMTMAQFLEMRYSRNFRKFAGILAWISGLVNFGIFPGVSARFFVNFCDLPPTFAFLGLEWSTFAVVMAVLVGLALFFTLVGGQISVLVTDFWQGCVAIVAITVILGFLAFSFSWTDITDGMVLASEPGNSRLNPFDIQAAAEFTIWFYMIVWFRRIYNHQNWQGGSAYDCSAVSAHEQKMARVIGQLRATLIQVGIILIPLVALAIMHNPKFAATAAEVTQQLASNYPGDSIEADQLREQMTVPTALTMILPPGLVGLFAAAMLGFFISTNNTYMHSWGTIFIQDVIMPFRKKPFSAKAHMRLLRLSIFGTAAYAFTFSLLFPVQEYIVMFFMITGAIFLGGSGAVIIGGMYWRKGTTKAAWWAMISGSGLAVGTIILRTLWPRLEVLQSYSEKFPLTGAESAFGAAIVAISLYVIISLLDHSEPKADFDKLFHRGKYAAPEDAPVRPEKKVGILWRLIGVNGREFNGLDKGLYLFTFGKTIIILASVLFMSVLHFLGILTIDHWKQYWLYYVIFLTGIGLVAGFWVSIGGFFDLFAMYRRLASHKRDDADDGWVTKEENDAIHHPDDNHRSAP